MMQYTAANTNHYRFINLVGQKFSRLLVVELLGKYKQYVYYRCKCDCGNELEASASKLKYGHVRSCGCLLADKNAARLTAHGASKGGRVSREYDVWRGIKNRCSNPNEPAYGNYGGRGIKVCKRWQSFENFLADMGNRPPGMSLDRKDNDGDYSPENCRWATRIEQANNTRSNRLLTLDGQTKTVADWNRHMGYPRQTIHNRLSLGWSVERAITQPVRRR